MAVIRQIIDLVRQGPEDEPEEPRQRNHRGPGCHRTGRNREEYSKIPGHAGWGTFFLAKSGLSRADWHWPCAFLGKKRKKRAKGRRRSGKNGGVGGRPGKAPAAKKPRLLVTVGNRLSAAA